MKSCLACSLGLALTIVLAACSPLSLGQSTLVPVPTRIEITPVLGTAISDPVLVGTLEPLDDTQPPLNYTPPPVQPPSTLTPIPTLPGNLGPTELKYRILEQFTDLFFCDPDLFPVAHEDIYKLAKERFSEVQANAEEFEAILEHNHLSGITSFSDEQMLQIYQEHKKLAAIQFTLDQAGYQFQLTSAAGEGNGVSISGLIDSQGVITVQKKEPVIATCPICLAGGTLIDTPSGAVPVEELYPGMLVWTQDRLGVRKLSSILRLNHTLVPSTHQVMHIILEDGRQLTVSPGHPTVDDRQIGSLRKEDLLDGSRVLAVERLAYTDHFTYDLLPAGDTGFYWANGILIASTLAQ